MLLSNSTPLNHFECLPNRKINPKKIPEITIGLTNIGNVSINITMTPSPTAPPVKNATIIHPNNRTNIQMMTSFKIPIVLFSFLKSNTKPLQQRIRIFRDYFFLFGLYSEMPSIIVMTPSLTPFLYDLNIQYTAYTCTRISIVSRIAILSISIMLLLILLKIYWFV